MGIMGLFLILAAVLGGVGLFAQDRENKREHELKIEREKTKQLETSLKE